jgi:hypothetical protein
MRSFGPKGKPAAGAATGAIAVEYKEPTAIPTNFQAMIKRDGIDQFLFGPPAGVEKMHNSHRDYILPKIGSRMEFFAKKMRE